MHSEKLVDRRRTPAGRARPRIAALIMGGACSVVALGQVSEGWDVNTSVELVYNIVVDMKWDPNTASFAEQDLRTLTVTINAGQVQITHHSAFEDETTLHGPYAFSEDGKMTVTPGQEPPPAEAEMLLHLFSPAPFNPGVTNWQLLDPDTSDLTLGKLELQEQKSYTHTGDRPVGNETWKDFDTEGRLRLIDNLFLHGLIGSPAERTPEVQQKVDALGQYNLYLYGSLSWSVDRRATTALDVTYVTMPHTGGTQASIGSSIYRQHLVATLEVAP